MSAASGSTNLGHGFPSPGPQSPTGREVMDHVFFLSNADWKQAREEGTYDLIIVGSGFCGYAVAHRALERDPHCRILILERGTFFLPEHFQNLPLPFVGTLGGMSETFPWTVSARTASGREGTITWQHGMVPFFGGRSTLWSAWCPRPSHDEMQGWPESTIVAAHARFDAAEALLRVQPADRIDTRRSNVEREMVQRRRPVYGKLQETLQQRLEQAIGTVGHVYRTQAAPLASAARNDDGIDFQKLSIPGELLALSMAARARHIAGQGAPLHIATDCVVERILEQGRTATGLVTSRGTLALGDAKLVLAMGTLPPTTLVRNSFPALTIVGQRFSAHFISSIVARVPKADLDPNGEFSELELGACYVAGTQGGDFGRQYHIQLSALRDGNPRTNAERALRYMPDVVATASARQLETSKDHVVLVCAVLGELDHENTETWFRANPQDADPTTNSLLQVIENASDAKTWEEMDEATFAILERVLSPDGDHHVEYWHGGPTDGGWRKDRPSPAERRVPALVHESSTLHIGEAESAPVALDYRLRGTNNVYVTGGALWPQGGSWNPTLTMVALAFHLADVLVPVASTSRSEPYLRPSHPDVRCVPLVTVPEAAPNGYRLAGVPDGIGAYASGRDEMTVLVTHEIRRDWGGPHAHGKSGAFVSRWVFDTSQWRCGRGSLHLVEGGDLIRKIHLWDHRQGSHVAHDDVRLTRLCSADLPVSTALCHGELGTTERLFLGGEEAHTGYDEEHGRAFAHIVTGSDAGTSWELPRLGRASFENVLLSPHPQLATIAFLPDDATERTSDAYDAAHPPSELFFYVGTKTEEGRADERAGLHNGKLYGVQVQVNDEPVVAEAPDMDFASARFVLVDLGDRSTDPGPDLPGVALQKDCLVRSVTRFLRPEDGAWDPRPSHRGHLWFVTTSEANSKLFHLVFDDIEDPKRGGTLRVITSARTHGHGQLDSVSVDPWGRVFLQEDPGGSDKVTSTLLWDGTALRRVAKGDPARFLDENSPVFITRNEEAAGIVPVFELLGEGWYLCAMQCGDRAWPEHLRPAGTSWTSWQEIQEQLVAPGQLIALYVPKDVEQTLSVVSKQQFGR